MRQNHQAKDIGSFPGSWEPTSNPITLPKVNLIGWVLKAFIVVFLIVKYFIETLSEYPKEIEKTTKFKFAINIWSDREVSEYFDNVEKAMFG